MFILTTVPPPTVLSNTKKFASGASRALNAFKISWPNTPPTTAQIGDISWLADELELLRILALASLRSSNGTHTRSFQRALREALACSRQPPRISSWQWKAIQGWHPVRRVAFRRVYFDTPKELVNS